MRETAYLPLALSLKNAVYFSKRNGCYLNRRIHFTAIFGDLTNPY